jgi:acetyl esterase/lipase
MSRADLWGPLRRLPLDGSREARDVVFATPDGCPLDLDVYEPPALSSEANPSPQANPSLNPSPQAGRDLRHPAVIVVAGGERGAAAHTLRCRWLAAQGYVVFAIDYRRAALWPAPLADVKCAIRWVKLNATRYRVDPARVALMGRWLGGHLALMAAYTANDATVPASCFGNDSVDDEVAAVIANGAPTDLRPGRGVLGIVVAQLMGGPADEMPAAYAQASPVTHARSGLPPTLLIHGQRDAVVLPTHAEWLANELRAAGGTVVLLRVPGARHGADSFVTGVTAPMIQYDVDRFLAWALRRDGQGS